MVYRYHTVTERYWTVNIAYWTVNLAYWGRHNPLVRAVKRCAASLTSLPPYNYKPNVHAVRSVSDYPPLRYDGGGVRTVGGYLLTYRLFHVKHCGKLWDTRGVGTDGGLIRADPTPHVATGKRLNCHFDNTSRI